MKHIKQYEASNNFKHPKVGDYVIMRSDANVPEIKTYINTHTGKVTKTYPYSLEVTYDNPPIVIGVSAETFKNREFSKDQIVDFSKNIDDLETKLSANKYNI